MVKKITKLQDRKMQVVKSIWKKLSPTGGVRIIFPFMGREHIVLEMSDLIKALKNGKPI